MGGVKKQCFNDIHKLLVNGNPEKIVLIEMNKTDEDEATEVLIVYVPKNEVTSFYKDFRRDQGQCEVDINKERKCIKLQVANQKIVHIFENSEDINMARDSIQSVCETVKDDFHMIMRAVADIQIENQQLRQVIDTQLDEKDKIRRIKEDLLDASENLESIKEDLDETSMSIPITDGLDMNAVSRRSLISNKFNSTNGVRNPIINNNQRSRDVSTNDNLISMMRNAEHNHRSYDDYDDDDDNMYDDRYNATYY